VSKQHLFSRKSKRHQPAWLLARVAVLLLGAGSIWLMLQAIYELNRTPYPGFEAENRPRLMVRQAVGDSLAVGDLILSVGDYPVDSALDWRILLTRLPRHSPLEIMVRRQGQTFPVSLTLDALLSARPELGPESLLLQVESAGADLPFEPGNRILSVDGLPANEANLPRIEKLLSGQNNTVMLIVLTRGRIKLAAVTREQLGQLRTEVVERYPVFIKSVHHTAPEDLQPGMQLVVVNGQPVINQDQVDRQLSELGFGAEVILNLKSEGEFQSVLFTISLNRWEQTYPAPLFHLLFALTSFALLIFLVVRHPRPGLAILHGLCFAGLMGAILHGWGTFYRVLAGLQTWTLPALVLLPPLVFFLLTEVPIRLDFLRSRRRLAQAGAGFPAIWAVAMLTAQSIGTHELTPALLSTVMAFALATGILPLSFWTLKKTRQPYERGPLIIHLLGLIPGLWLPLLGLAFESIHPDCQLCWYTALLVLAGINLPLALCYDFWRRRVQYTDVLLKKSLAFVLASGAVILLYFIVVVWSGGTIHKLLRISPLWIVLLVLLLSAFLFQPLNTILLGWLDRLFYRSQMGYRAYILQASRELNYVMEIPRIIDLTLNKICQVAYLQGGYFFLRQSGGMDF